MQNGPSTTPGQLTPVRRVSPGLLRSLVLRTVCATAFIFLTGLLAGCVAPRQSARRSEMPYPFVAAPKPEDIYHVPTGLKLSVDQAMDMIAGARLVCIGETHDSLNSHRVEAQVIRELYRRFPGRIAIGMEMFREPHQAALDRWTRGELSELEFLKASQWYSNWHSDFRMYRDILTFARDNHIDVVALNPPQELQKQVSSVGLEKLPDEVRKQLPQIDTSDPFQRAILERIFNSHGAGHMSFDSFYQVQLLWEEAMAANVVKYLESDRGRGKVIITLTGGWHVQYGFGLPKKVLRRMPMPYTILMTQDLADRAEPKGRRMDLELPDIPLLPADFVWMVAYAELEPTPKMGVWLVTRDSKVVVEVVSEGSPAQKAGIQKGDEIVSINGVAVTAVEDVYQFAAEHKMGDKGTFVIRRDGGEQTVVLEFTPMKGP